MNPNIPVMCRIVCKNRAIITQYFFSTTMFDYCEYVHVILIIFIVINSNFPYEEYIKHYLSEKLI